MTLEKVVRRGEIFATVLDKVRIQVVIRVGGSDSKAREIQFTTSPFHYLPTSGKIKPKIDALAPRVAAKPGQIILCNTDDTSGLTADRGCWDALMRASARRERVARTDSGTT